MVSCVAMRCRLTDGSREIWIVDEFWDQDGRPGRALSPAEAAGLIRSLALDPSHAATLRRMRDPHSRGSTDDTFDAFHDPIAMTIADVFAGRLSVQVITETVGNASEPVTETLELEPEDAQPLAVLAEPEPEPIVPPDVLAQVAALVRASEIGAPFCEE